MVKKLTMYSYLESFLNYNSEGIHLSEISKKLNQPHPTVRQYLNEFQEQGILRKINKGKLSIYSLNKDSQLIIDLLVLAEKDRLIRKASNELILKEVVHFLHSLTGVKEILLFGSSCEDSKKAKDIDVLIVGKTKIQPSLIEKKIGKKLHLVQVSDLNKVSSALKEEIKKKHLIVKNSEDLIQWLI